MMGEQSAAVLIALINTVGLIVVGVSQARTSGRTKAIKHQVENDHAPRNLRDDIDRIGDAVKLALLKLSRLGDIQETQSNDIRGLRSEIGQIRQIEREQWAAIDENTNPRRRRNEEHSQS